MLTTNQLKQQKAIAGASSGRKVLCSAQALPVFNNLLQLAKGGNHWARLAVQGITGLTSGRLNKENIYIEKKQSMAYGKGAFHIVLPGVTASLEELPNGSYILQRIKTDNNYQKLQKESEKPGLWRVDKDKNIEPTFQSDSRILNKEYRPVVIADMSNANVPLVAEKVRDDLVKTDGTIKNMVRDYGFDMHYTPGAYGIVGLKKATSALATAKDSEITQSAMLLAKTMFQARKINGVLWYSDWGGSAVLTRAMEILHHEKNISLKNHSIFMNRPTTKTNYAIELGEKLGLTPNAKGMNTGLHPKELVGNIQVSSKGALKTTAFGVGTAGATLGVLGASLTAAGIVGVVGAMLYVSNAVKSGSKNLSARKY